MCIRDRYDGVCGFCGWCVALAIRRNRDAFHFATLQGAVARNLLEARDASALEQLDTIYVVDQEGNILNRSEAVAFVMRRLGWPWSWAGLLVGVLPGCIRDFLYGVVAHNRYLFGVCQVGAPRTQRRAQR